jgi:hypothetical protein
MDRECSKYRSGINKNVNLGDIPVHSRMVQLRFDEGKDYCGSNGSGFGFHIIWTSLSLGSRSLLFKCWCKNKARKKQSAWPPNERANARSYNSPFMTDICHSLFCLELRSLSNGLCVLQWCIPPGLEWNWFHWLPYNLWYRTKKERRWNRAA